MPSPQLPLILAALRVRSATRERLSVADSRAAFENLARVCPVAPDVAVEPMTAGGVPVEWLTPPGVDRARALLFLHGGAYVMGSLSTHRDLASRLARAAGARALTVGYRLAPEHRFPAALDDALAAYRWLLAEGFEPRHIAVAGDSAGGGLALAMLVALRDRGLPLPAAFAGLSVNVDLEGTGESMDTRAANDPVIQRRFLLETARHYLGDHDRRDPLASPLYADLAGLPPMLLQVGSLETLLDDSTRLAERARAAGVEARLEVWEDMFHGWQLYAKMLPEGRAAIEQVGEFVRETCAVSYSDLASYPGRFVGSGQQ